jgi:hypothetical protein
MIKTALLLAHGGAWLTVMAITAVNNGGRVPSELWTVLPLGISAIIVAFRAEGKADATRDRSEGT